MSGSLTTVGGENDPGIPGAYATSNFTYLVRGPWEGRSYMKTRKYSDIFISIRYCSYVETQEPHMTVSVSVNRVLRLGPALQGQSVHDTGLLC